MRFNHGELMDVEVWRPLGWVLGVVCPVCLLILRCTGIPFYPKSLDKWHERFHVLIFTQ